MEFLSLGEFGFACCSVVLTRLDAVLDGIIGQDFFFRFTACNEGKRGGRQERNLERGRAFHTLPLRPQVVMLAAFRMPATNEHAPSQIPAATSLASILSEMRGMGRRIRR